MGELTNGWRSLLSPPEVYNLCMNLLKGNGARRTFVETYIRPYAGMRILDLGCGPANILDCLPKDIVYTGVDLSQSYIDAAQKKYGARGFFFCAPLDSLSKIGLKEFDIVMGIGVLHHLDDGQAENFFKIVSKVLTAKGRCLTIDPCLISQQHAIARFLISLDRGRNVRTPDQYKNLIGNLFPHVTQVVAHNRLRVPYTHCIMECSKL